MPVTTTMKAMLAATALLIPVSFTAAALPPDTVNFQGVLRDATDAPLDGSFDMVFRFFDADVAGDEILVDAHLASGTGAVIVTGGLYTVRLGGGAVTDGSGPGTYGGLGEVFRDFQDVWMEMVVDGETLSPRVRVEASPYALNAGHLAGRSGSEYLDTSAASQTKTGSLTIGGQLSVTGGGPGTGKVLTSDASGLGSWEDPQAVVPNAELVELAERLGVPNPADRPFAELRPFDCAVNPASLSLSIGGVGVGDVVGFIGSEEISRPSRYDVLFRSSDPLIDPDAQIGSVGRVTLTRGASVQTTFSGVVTGFGLAGETGGKATYVARIEPLLTRLARSTGYRMYLENTAPQILSGLLSDDGQSNVTDSTSLTYSPLEMEIRYGENGLDFFNRVAERDGIHYHFEESASQEQLVLGDAAAAFALLSGSFDHYGDQVDPGTGEEYVATFRAPKRLFTGDATVRTNDYEDSDQDVTGTANRPGGVGELYEYQADLGDDFSSAVNNVRAGHLVDREQVRRHAFEGTGNEADFKAGHRFTLVDNSAAGFGGEYVLTSVTHFARTVPASSCVEYGNTFTVVPSSVTYRPARRTSLPFIDGPITATVTGPAGEDFYTEAGSGRGRVKVQFHFDRVGAFNENSSGWVPVATPPGKTRRDVYLPRIGTEVLIDFVQGDPSQPVIVGSLYNANEPTRFVNNVDDWGPTATGKIYIDDGESRLAGLDDQYIYFWNGSRHGFPSQADLESAWLGFEPQSLGEPLFEFSEDLYLPQRLLLERDTTPAAAALSWDVGNDRFNLNHGAQIEGPIVGTSSLSASGLITATGGLLATGIGVDVNAGGLRVLSGNSEFFGPVKLNGASLDMVGGSLKMSGGTGNLDLDINDAQVTAGGLMTIDVVGKLQIGTLDLRANSDNHWVEIIDDDNNSANRIFGWFHDGTATNANKLADLDELGSLRVRGTVTPNVSFDLAESFLAAGPAEPGDLVRLNPARPGSVLRTTGVGDALVLGVVSERPGLLLGGAPFDPGALRDTWGEPVAEEYSAAREGLRQAVLAAHADLQAEAAMVAAAVEAVVDGDLPANLAERRRALEERLESLCLEEFAAERFVPVALAGRVPVNVDATTGAIVPGDALAPGPRPGVAVKATGAGPIVGTALEGLADGRGKVLTFVHRGWYAPPGGASLVATGGQGRPVSAAGVVDVATAGREGASGAPAPAPAGAAAAGEAPGARVFRVDAEGNVFADGAFHPRAMDVAEYFPLGESAEVGDVLVVDPERQGLYAPASLAQDPTVVGIVSGEPGVLLGSGIRRLAEADASLSVQLELAGQVGDTELEEQLWDALRARFRETHAPVALSGTVPCKVDAGYGAIRPGDLLTTSPTTGHAMRAPDAAPGTIVGKALEPLEGGTGTIRVLVMLR